MLPAAEHILSNLSVSAHDISVGKRKSAILQKQKVTQNSIKHSYYFSTAEITALNISKI